MTDFGQMLVCLFLSELVVPSDLVLRKEVSEMSGVRGCFGTTPTQPHLTFAADYGQPRMTTSIRL